MIEVPNRGDGLPVVLRRELVAAGHSDDEIGAAVRDGQLERLCRGALCRPVTADDPRQLPLNRYVRRVIARALGLPSCVVSHLSAAALHALPADCASLNTVHLTRVGVGGSRKTPGFVQHAAAIPHDQVVAVGSLRVTSVARTLVDVGRSESLRSAVAMADQALHLGMVSGAQVTAALAEASGRPGSGSAQRALALADGRSESVGESFLRIVMRQVGLPAAELQVDVWSAAGVVLARCDLGYPQFAVLIEFDGLGKYRGLLRPGEDAADAVIREKRREEALVEAGYVVVRVTWSDLHDPAELATRIRRAIARGSRNLAGGMVTGVCLPRPPLRIGG